METHPLCQPSATTATETATAWTDTIRHALGDGGGGGQWHHVVVQFDDAGGGQRHHLSSRK